MRIIYVVILAIFLFSCSADIVQISQNFVARKADFELLDKMIKEDYKGNHCFAIGTDNIGRYWKYGDKWSSLNDYRNKLTLSQVLHHVSIPLKRYKIYEKLFKSSNTERITLCNMNNEPRTSFLVYRSGLTVSGCIIDIEKTRTTPRGWESQIEGKFDRVIYLVNDWYLVHHCR